MVRADITKGSISPGYLALLKASNEMNKCLWVSKQTAAVATAYSSADWPLHGFYITDGGPARVRLFLKGEFYHREHVK